MIIEEILKFNREFVEKKRYEKFLTSKYPDKKLAILSCMDTRLTEGHLRTGRTGDYGDCTLQLRSMPHERSTDEAVDGGTWDTPGRH